MRQEDIVTALAQKKSPLTAMQICEALGVEATITALNTARNRAQKLVQWGFVVVIDDGPLKMWAYKEDDGNGP